MTEIAQAQAEARRRNRALSKGPKTPERHPSRQTDEALRRYWAAKRQLRGGTDA